MTVLVSHGLSSVRERERVGEMERARTWRGMLNNEGRKIGVKRGLGLSYEGEKVPARLWEGKFSGKGLENNELKIFYSEKSNATIDQVDTESAEPETCGSDSANLTEKR